MNRTVLWQRIQREQPEIAWIMAEVRRVFGKTPTPTIKLGGEVVWGPAVALRRGHDRHHP